MLSRTGLTSSPTGDRRVVFLLKSIPFSLHAQLGPAAGIRARARTHERDARKQQPPESPDTRNRRMLGSKAVAELTRLIEILFKNNQTTEHL